MAEYFVPENISGMKIEETKEGGFILIIKGADESKLHIPCSDKDTFHRSGQQHVHFCWVLPKPLA